MLEPLQMLRAALILLIFLLYCIYLCCCLSLFFLNNLKLILHNDMHLKNSLKAKCVDGERRELNKEHLTADLHTQTQLILVTQGHKNFALDGKRWSYDADVQQSRFTSRSVHLLSL